jgi:DNA-binding phage protein
MGIKFGDVDANQILQNEFRIEVLEYLFDTILQNNPQLILQYQSQVESIRNKVAKKLQKKYPNSGIEYKRK